MTSDHPITLMPVDEALERVLAAAKKTDTITLPLHDADGYTVSQDVKATRTQPPFSASAMDGYAVRHADLALEKSLRIIGEAAAGHQFSGVAKDGEAVRIFTGAPIPQGTDTVLIQEDAVREGDTLSPTKIPGKGLFVRPSGMDFNEGDTLLETGTLLNFQSLSLAAAMNHPILPVYKKPRVGIISNGDELVYPGQTPRDDQIIASNTFGVASLVRQNGGEAVDLGIAADKTSDILTAFDHAAAKNCDILVTLGGASVGDHDLIKPALEEKNITLDFWKIAMRPGKPFMFGSIGDMLMLGMPGNPVSSLVCSLLFLRPLLFAMQGRDPSHQLRDAILGADVAKNGQRQAYLRAHAEKKQADLIITPFAQQDSSILSVLAKANCLLIREPHAPADKKEATCKIMWI